MFSTKVLLKGIEEVGVERSSFQRRYRTEDLIDLDYVLSVGGMDFVRNIRPLFQKSAIKVLEMMMTSYENGNIQEVQRGLSRLMGTANAAGGLKIVRCIMTMQMLIDQGKRDLSRELLVLIGQFKKFDNFLTSPELKIALDTAPRS